MAKFSNSFQKQAFEVFDDEDQISTSEQNKLKFSRQLRHQQTNKTSDRQEREKLNVDWIVTKKELEDLKGEVINKEREVEDLKENHIMTINLYKQR